MERRVAQFSGGFGGGAAAAAAAPAAAAAAAAAAVVVTRAPLFVEKARLLPGCRFAVGFDTAVRLLMPQYYPTAAHPGGSEAAMYDASFQGVQVAAKVFSLAGAFSAQTDKMREVHREFAALKRAQEHHPPTNIALPYNGPPK